MCAAHGVCNEVVVQALPNQPTSPIQHTTHNAQHSTQYTVHSTQYTVHSTQYTVHSTQYTTHSTQHTVHNTQHTLHARVFGSGVELQNFGIQCSHVMERISIVQRAKMDPSVGEAS